MCDVCDSGYMIAASACVACSPGCKRCHDQTPGECDACFFLYAAREDGGCAFSWPKLFCTLCAIGAAGWFLSRLLNGRHVLPSRPVPTVDTFLGGDRTPPESPYPTGAWRGYYTVSGHQHGVVEFELAFESGGGVHGSGADDVGSYTLHGRCARDGRVALTKQYEARSRTSGGRLSSENLGHAVEYRGEPARRLEGGGPSLSGGLRGRWSIRHARGDFDGTWHLWPVVLPPAPPGGHDEATDEDNECVVCYDRRINTCLQPCGHVALCDTCARRLEGRRCPLCREPILDIVSSDA